MYIYIYIYILCMCVCVCVLERHGSMLILCVSLCVCVIVCVIVCAFVFMYIAAATDKCWVFDLKSTEPGSDDFSGALLKCLLNGVVRPGHETKETLFTKLKYTMLWSRDDLMTYLLERMSAKIKDEQRIEIFDDAILFALQKNKGLDETCMCLMRLHDTVSETDSLFCWHHCAVHALHTLLERGAGLKSLDVGNRFCFVQHHRKRLERNVRYAHVRAPACVRARTCVQTCTSILVKHIHSAKETSREMTSVCISCRIMASKKLQWL